MYYLIVLHKPQGFKMRIAHHILSQRRHILAHKKKKTTRPAYATLKTFSFLRSLNVKDSAPEP
jgi:hypothetical protein